MNSHLVFAKNGKEIKMAISNRLEALNIRLDKRNEELDKFLENTNKVRSYLLRSTLVNYGHGGRYFSGGNLFSDEHIASEEVEEINQLTKRIMEIEQEINKLNLTIKHLKNEQQFELTFDELCNFGFN